MINTNISALEGPGVDLKLFVAQRASAAGKNIMVVTNNAQFGAQWLNRLPGASHCTIMQLWANGGVAPWATEYLLIVDLYAQWWPRVRDFLHAIPEEVWAVNGPDDICIPPQRNQHAHT